KAFFLVEGCFHVTGEINLKDEPFVAALRIMHDISAHRQGLIDLLRERQCRRRRVEQAVSPAEYCHLVRIRGVLRGPIRKRPVGRLASFLGCRRLSLERLHRVCRGLSHIALPWCLAIKSPPPPAPAPSSSPLPRVPFYRLRGARPRRNPAVPPAPCAG